MLGLRVLCRVALFGIPGLCALCAESSALAADSSPEPSPPPMHQVPVSERSEQELANRNQARSLFEQGQLDYRAGRYAEAVDHLLAADRILHSAKLLFNLSLAYEALGDCAGALRNLRAYVRESADASDDVTGRIRALEEQLAKQGLQQVTVLSEPPGARVEIDAQPRGVTPSTLELPFGQHRVSLSSAGFSPETTLFVVNPEHAMDLTVELTKVPTAAAAPPPVIAQSPREPSANTRAVSEPASKSRVGVVTWVGLAATFATFAAAGTLEVLRAGADRDAQSASQVDYQASYDRMHSLQTAARVCLVSGVALGVASGIKLAIDLSNHGHSAATASVGSCGGVDACAHLGLLF